jgi:MAF protein
MKNYKLVLASSSEYRKVLLEKLHLSFICATPNIDESAQASETAQEQALRLAKQKAHALASIYPKHVIIAADQVAMLGNSQLHKPGNQENAIRQLQKSSGKRIKFYTGICVLDTTTMSYKLDIDICSVYFKELSTHEIKNYVLLEQPYNCAGSFKSEGLGIALFKRIESDDPNALIGLPLIKLIGLLETFNINVLAQAS